MPYVIEKLHDTHLILIGDGSLLNYCKNLSKSLGIQQHTTFLGFIKEKELLKYYASSTIFVFPSELEGFGQVIIEAMASGTPVISFPGGPSETIQDGKTGYIIKNYNLEIFAQKVIKLLEDKNLYEKFSKNAKEHVMNNFNFEKSVSNLEMILEKIVSSD